MIQTLAVANYRSLLDLKAELGSLTVISGPNGSGKSNLYRALRLLADTAQDGVVGALAGEGGLPSALWAGPETVSKAMRSGKVPVQGTPRQQTVRLQLGFAAEDFGYAIALGLPAPLKTQFNLDPEIKRECIWSGPVLRPATLLVDRQGPTVRSRSGRTFEVLASHVPAWTSIFGEVADAERAPEVLALRQRIRDWRFYDQFRTDRDAPARSPRLGTRTPVLHHDGRDLAAALQTIREIGDAEALDAAIDDAFPGSRVEVEVSGENWFSVRFHQHGLLRPLSAAELSDGTLRYLLLVAALLTPRPPPMLVLNEPETSLHPDLLPALGRLIVNCAQDTQVWVVSHASRLIAALEQSPGCVTIELEKKLGATAIIGQGMLDEPRWEWPKR